MTADPVCVLRFACNPSRHCDADQENTAWPRYRCGVTSPWVKGKRGIKDATLDRKDTFSPTGKRSGHYLSNSSYEDYDALLAAGTSRGGGAGDPLGATPQPIRERHRCRRANLAPERCRAGGAYLAVKIPAGRFSLHSVAYRI
jgi:hypothetical protein